MHRLLAVLALCLGGLTMSYAPGLSQQQPSAGNHTLIECKDFPELCDCKNNPTNCQNGKMDLKIIQFFHNNNKPNVKVEAMGKIFELECSDVPELCKKKW